VQVRHRNPRRELHDDMREEGNQHHVRIKQRGTEPNEEGGARIHGGYRGVVRVRGRHGGGGLGGELVELAGGDALVNPRADLLRDEDGVAVLLAEPVAELLEPRRDLVEVHHLVAAVPLHHVHLPSNTLRARPSPPPR
jgi:hypothetical protein